MTDLSLKLSLTGTGSSNHLVKNRFVMQNGMEMIVQDMKTTPTRIQLEYGGVSNLVSGRKLKVLAYSAAFEYVINKK